MKLLYHASLWVGSTALQRCEAFARQPGVEVVPHDTRADGVRPGLAARIWWRLRWPIDSNDENERLVAAVSDARPDVVLVDNSRVITRETLRRLRAICDPLLVYYSPDDIVAPHNLSYQLRATFPDWDVFFTTKTFNVGELAARGVRNPVLIGNSFDAEMHRPMTREEVGPDFEKYDLVFVGTFEKERFRSIERLAEAGFSVSVCGSRAGLLSGRWDQLSRPDLVHHTAARFGLDYARQLHHGRVALCFLRKINRDQITTRSIEIPAIGRPMLAEQTAEHDAHFENGEEYLSFGNDEELIRQARRLLDDEALRNRIASRGRQRCLASGYSTDHRAKDLLAAMQRVRGSEMAAGLEA